VETIAMPKGQNAAAEGDRSLRDYARLRADVAAKLERLAEINETVGQPTRAVRIREAREALLEQRFMLLVLGEFKRGKSTLVNRLLGVDTLPVGAAPTTAVLTRVTYGDEPSATIVMDDGSERAVDPDRLGEEITLIQPATPMWLGPRCACQRRSAATAWIWSTRPASASTACAPR